MEEKTARRQIPELSGICLYPPAEAGYRCIPPALQLLKEVVCSYTPEEGNQHQENQEDPTIVILGVVANLFQKVIELLARRLRKQPEEGKQVFKVYLLALHWSQTFMMWLLNFSTSFATLQLCHSAVPGLTDFLQAVLIWDSASLIGVFSTLFAAILVENRHLLQKVGMSSACLIQILISSTDGRCFLKMTHPDEVTIPESIDDMPPLSSVLLSVILKVPSVTK